MAFAQAWTGVSRKDIDAGTTLVAAAITTVTGRTVVVGVTRDNAAPGTTDIADNMSNTYTRITTVQVTSGDFLGLYYCENIIGGAGHTITLSNVGGRFAVLTAVALSGVLTSGVLDSGSGTNTGSGVSTLTTGNKTTSVKDDLIGYFAIATSSNQTWNNNGSSTVRSSSGNGATTATGGLYTRDAIAAGTVTVTGNYGNETGNYAAIFAGFKNVTTAPPPYHRSQRFFRRMSGLLVPAGLVLGKAT